MLTVSWPNVEDPWLPVIIAVLGTKNSLQRLMIHEDREMMAVKVQVEPF